MSIIFKNECGACIDTPLCNKTTMYVDNCDGSIKVIDNSWCVNTISCAADLASLAECCDVPTNNNQLSNWCWYIKWFWTPQSLTVSYDCWSDCYPHYTTVPSRWFLLISLYPSCCCLSYTNAWITSWFSMWTGNSFRTITLPVNAWCFCFRQYNWNCICNCSMRPSISFIPFT